MRYPKNINPPGNYTNRLKGGSYGVLGIVKAAAGFIGCTSGTPVSLYNVKDGPGMYAMPDASFFNTINRDGTKTSTRGSRYGSATLAGSCEVFKDDWLQLYQCRESGKMYVRLLSDFNLSMRIANEDTP